MRFKGVAEQHDGFPHAKTCKDYKREPGIDDQ